MDNLQLSLNAVVEQLDVSRPAISKHIKTPVECDLLEIKQQGKVSFHRNPRRKGKRQSDLHPSQRTKENEKRTICH